MTCRPALFFACLALCMLHVYGDRVYGICYTPFRAFGVCPTDAEVESDVDILLRHTTRVRIYSTECRNVNRILLKHSSKGRLSVLFGVYVDNRPTDQQEVDYLIDALSEFPNGRIEGVVVGNEVMYRNSMPKHSLIHRINEVRDKVRGLGYHTGNQNYLTAPIYAVEMFPDVDIGGASDVLGLNIHPFYRPDLVDIDDPEVMSDNILIAAQQQIDLYRNMIPHKQIVVTEIGWPSQSDHTEQHRGDPIIGLKFFEKFRKYVEENSIPFYWFELFDSVWKHPMFPSNQKTMSEFNFGLYKSDRKTKKTLPGGCGNRCRQPQPPPPPPAPVFHHPVAQSPPPAPVFHHPVAQSPPPAPVFHHPVVQSPPPDPVFHHPVAQSPPPAPARSEVSVRATSQGGSSSYAAAQSFVDNQGHSPPGFFENNSAGRHHDFPSPQFQPTFQPYRRLLF